MMIGILTTTKLKHNNVKVIIKYNKAFSDNDKLFIFFTSTCWHGNIYLCKKNNKIAFQCRYSNDWNVTPNLKIKIQNCIPVFIWSRNCLCIYLVSNRLVTCDINFVHINKFNLLIKVYLSLIFIKYFINEFRVQIKF
jgi:hypothetical protein